MNDALMLEVLELRNRHRMSPNKIAKELSLTKNQVMGVLFRCSQDVGPTKHDGTMPPRWWEEGLKKRGEEIIS